MEITPELLEKYYLGKCTPEEILAVEQWQGSNEHGGDLVLSETEKKALENEIWQRLEKATVLLPAGPASDSMVSMAGKRKPSRLFWRAAASALLITSIAALFIRQHSAKQKNGTIVYKTFSTARGQKASVTLTDGTVVVLNSESSLQYPEHFAGTARILYLKGEGYFRVAKDPSRPFSVYTARTLTRVLGTVFDLKAYEHEPATLAVEEGRVRFGDLNNLPPTIYTAGRWSQFDLNGALSTKMINAADYTAWKENKLIFTGQTLAQIIPVLKRWYNVNIKMTNPALSELRFTGEFNNVSINFILDRMSFVMKFHYVLHQQTITIR